MTLDEAVQLGSAKGFYVAQKTNSLILANQAQDTEIGLIWKKVIWIDFYQSNWHLRNFETYEPSFKNLEDAFAVAEQCLTDEQFEENLFQKTQKYKEQHVAN